MNAVLVDANVLLDVMTEDARWVGWSAKALERAADSHRLVINPVIYAEVSLRYSRIEELDAALPKSMFDREAIPLRSRLSRGQVVLSLPPTRRNKAVAASGFLHRHPRRRRRISTDDAGYRSLSNLLPQADADRSRLGFAFMIAPLAKT
jgi:predicted nucleic acid-binding protein